MRPEGRNPLDLNNLPEDYSRSDGKQVMEADSFSTGHGKKKSGTKEGKEDAGKVYECRFCSLKFCKSQALGGHMNRHRQERETETLNRARHIVYINDNLAAQPPPPHALGFCHPITPAGSYHQQAAGINMGLDQIPTLPPRFPTRIHNSLLTPNQPPINTHTVPFSYTSPPRHPNSHQQHHWINDHFVGHVLGPQNAGYGSLSSGTSALIESNYTCIGAPVGGGPGPHGFGSGGSNRVSDHTMAVGSVGRGGGHDLVEGIRNNSWGTSTSASTSAGATRSSYAVVTSTTSFSQQQRNLDVSSSINRFQDGF